MRTIILLLFLFVFSFSIKCQIKIHLNPGVVISNEYNKNEVFDLFNEYYQLVLKNKLDEAKKLWSKNDTLDFVNPNLNYHIINTSVPIYNQGYITVMSIKNVRDSIYQLKLMVGWADSLHPATILITNQYIIQSGEEFKLTNKFRVYSDIKRKKIGKIQFIYRNNTSLNFDSLVVESTKLYNKVFSIFPQAENLEKTIVIGENNGDINYIMGNDYTVFDAVNNPSGGITNIENQLAICQNIMNFNHELTHLFLNNINNQFKFYEGLATYFGGHFGKNYKAHLEQLKLDIDIDTVDFYSKLVNQFFYINSNYNPNYIIQSLIVDYVITNFELNRVQTLIHLSNWDEIFDFAFGVDDSKLINEKIRKLILSNNLKGALDP